MLATRWKEIDKSTIRSGAPSGKLLRPHWITINHAFVYNDIPVNRVFDDTHQVTRAWKDGHTIYARWLDVTIPLGFPPDLAAVGVQLAIKNNYSYKIIWETGEQENRDSVDDRKGHDYSHFILMGGEGENKVINFKIFPIVLLEGA